MLQEKRFGRFAAVASAAALCLAANAFTAPPGGDPTVPTQQPGSSSERPRAARGLSAGPISATIAGAAPASAGMRSWAEGKATAASQLVGSLDGGTDADATSALQLQIEATAALLEQDKVSQGELGAQVAHLQREVARTQNHRSAERRLYAALDRVLGDNGAVVAVNIATGETVVAYNPNEVFVPASTYKIFTAYSMLAAVESGTAKWEEQLLPGRTLQQCFSDMIVWSDNACPMRWRHSGRRNHLDEELPALGINNTALNKLPQETTAADLAHFLYLLIAGDLLDNGSRQLLLEEMSNQSFREGIPAGLPPGVLVADKVGFLEGNLHDAAIIHSAKGTFALVILTKNLSWESISTAARVVYEFL